LFFQKLCSYALAAFEKKKQQAKVSGAGKRKGKGKEGSTKNKAAVLLLH